MSSAPNIATTRRAPPSKGRFTYRKFGIRRRTGCSASITLKLCRSAIPGALNQYTMPTALERQAIYPSLRERKIIPVTNPSTGRPYPGNIVPATDLNPNGLALLKSLALPNFTNRAISGGNYNYQIQEVFHNPKRSQLFRSTMCHRTEIVFT